LILKGAIFVCEVVLFYSIFQIVSALFGAVLNRKKKEE